MVDFPSKSWKWHQKFIQISFYKGPELKAQWQFFPRTQEYVRQEKQWPSICPRQWKRATSFLPKGFYTKLGFYRKQAEVYFHPHYVPLGLQSKRGSIFKRKDAESKQEPHCMEMSLTYLNYSPRVPRRQLSMPPHTQGQRCTSLLSDLMLEKLRRHMLNILVLTRKPVPHSSHTEKHFSRG